MAVLLAVGAFIARPAMCDEPRFIRIGTGSTGGTYFPVGGLIANAISNPPGSMDCQYGGSCGVPGLVASAVSTEGSAENVVAVGNGSMELALAQADVADFAYHGEKPFDTLAGADRVRAITMLFPEQLHIVIRQDSGIKSGKDMRGKRISVGAENSGTIVSAKAVLRGFGLGLDTLKVITENIDRSSDLLIEGTLDGVFMLGGYPVNAIQHLASTIDVGLLSIPPDVIEELEAKYPFFTQAIIPADTYSGVPETETVSMGAMLITSAAVDESFVYAVTRALWDPRNRKILDSGHRNARLIRLETAFRGLTIPLHPGAERYYAEIGMLPTIDN
jgi:hypothetical protein